MTTLIRRTEPSRPRPTLADQLDRLDRILDGLGEALTDAVAQAVREGVAAGLADVARRPNPVHLTTDAPPPPAAPAWRYRLREAVRYAANCGRRLAARAVQTIGRTWARATAEPQRRRVTSAAMAAFGILAGTATRCRALLRSHWPRHRRTRAGVVVAAGLAAAIVGASVKPAAAALFCGGLGIALVLAAARRPISAGRPTGSDQRLAGNRL